MWHIRDKQTCCRWLRPNIVWTCNDKCNKHNDHRRIGIISIVVFFFSSVYRVVWDCNAFDILCFNHIFFSFSLDAIDNFIYWFVIWRIAIVFCVRKIEQLSYVNCDGSRPMCVCVCMCEWRSYVPFKCCRRTQPLRVILVIFSISILIHSSQTILSFSDSIATKWLHARTYTFHLLHTFYSSNSNHLMRQRAPGDDWIRETRILRVERCPCGCVFSVLQHNYYATEATT